ncbi:hypothetical protein N2605_26450 [Bradyrhizobium yuanmingense]|nr:hypothetical protein [Bradyrhizobium sp. CB1024]UWU83082.1 hypothetical protein N2605_26450 [Bradyrhizobium sp. CB1024]
MSLFDIARNNIALSAPAALILIAAAQPVSTAGRLLSARWLVFLGEASFGLYLVHSVVYQRLPVVRWRSNSELFGHISALALAFTVAACVAVLLHFIFEVPARKLIRRSFQAASAMRRRHLIRWGTSGFVALMVAALTYATGAATGDPITQEGILIVAGTYGGNCGIISVRGNATHALAAACNGRDYCTFKVKVEEIGDTAPGCAKEFTAVWICKGERTIRSSSVPAEAGLDPTLQVFCNH